MDNKKELLNSREAAEFLKASYESFRKHIRFADAFTQVVTPVVHYKGAHPLWKRSELQAYLDSFSKQKAA